MTEEKKEFETERLIDPLLASEFLRIFQNLC